MTHGFSPGRGRLCEKGMLLSTSGSRNKGIIMQPRDRRLLSELRSRRFVDREQASAICGFRSASRAKARLLALVRANYLDRFFVGTIAGGRRAIYFLPKTRRQRLQRVLASPSTEQFVEHQLAVNVVVLAARQHGYRLDLVEREWSAIRSNQTTRIRPDAILEQRTDSEVRGLLIEVDLATESMRVIRQKVSRYLALARSGLSEQLLGIVQCRVLFVVRGGERLESLRKVVASETERVFWFAEIETIRREGFWARVWLRPTGEERHSLN